MDTDRKVNRHVRARQTGGQRCAKRTGRDREVDIVIATNKRVRQIGTDVRQADRPRTQTYKTDKWTPS